MLPYLLLQAEVCLHIGSLVNNAENFYAGVIDFRHRSAHVRVAGERLNALEHLPDQSRPDIGHPLAPRTRPVPPRDREARIQQNRWSLWALGH